MGSDARVLLFSGGDAALDASLGALPGFTHRAGWFESSGADATERRTQELSAKHDTWGVFWTIHTVVDQIWIQAFDSGRQVRELRYSAEEGWAVDRGGPLPFEGEAALKKWKTRRGLLASPHGYELLEAFLGNVVDLPDEVPPIVAEGANVELSLPSSIVEDARAIAARRGVRPELVLIAAWELGKFPLYTREAAKLIDRDVSRARPGPAEIPGGFALARGPESPLELSRERVRCALKLSDAAIAELRELVRAFDRPASWFVVEAYRIVRSELG